MSRFFVGVVHSIDWITEPLLAEVPEPRQDWFYNVDDGQHRPGQLLEWRRVDVRAFWRTVPVDAWQIRYSSTDGDNMPVTAIATVMVPRRERGTVDRLVSYQCAIDSLGARADPSYTLRRGNQNEWTLIRGALRRGWAVVTSDYTGPRRSFGAGSIAGRLVLDGIRAALALPSAGLGGDIPVALWGYSCGGHASLWAAELHPTYAPELDIVVTAAGGVPADLNVVAVSSDGSVFSGLALGVVAGIAREFPDFDLDGMANDHGRATLRRIADMRAEDIVAALPWRRMSDFSVLERPLEDARLRKVLTRNSLGSRIPRTRVYLYHATRDRLVPIGCADKLVEHYRAHGTDVVYHRNRVAGHVSYFVFGAAGALRVIDSAFTEAKDSMSSHLGSQTRSGDR